MRVPSFAPHEGIVWKFLLVALLVFAGAAVGCGGGSTKAPTVVTVLPRGASIIAGHSLTLNAMVSDGSSVNWSVSGGGMLDIPIGNTVVYTAPLSVSSNTNTIVTATTASGASGYISLTILPDQNTFPNVQPVTVNGGPIVGKIYPNAAFTSITICTPGTTTCNTIDGILVDTASIGLRVLASALPSLPALKDDQGNNINECAQFVDQSYVWGQVAFADVKISGEVANSLPIQVIADPSGFAIPSACSNSGSGKNKDTQETLGANGILGIGLEPQDCGVLCVQPTGGGTPPSPAYYSCSGSSCNPAFVALEQQVTHPVIRFAKDNNGWWLQLQPLTGATTALTGSLIFGIQTQPNNAFVNATVFTLNIRDHFTVNLPNTGQSLSESFIDSGLNGLFFPDGNLAVCSGSNAAFFCPASSTSLSAVNVGANNAQSTINFIVDNADQLFSSNPSAAAFSTLAGPNGSGACSGGSGACSFVWGLPFFYGRSVIGSINGQTLPQGESPGIPNLPPAPWWAYTTGFSGH